MTTNEIHRELSGPVNASGIYDGFYFPPTIISDATLEMLVLTEETFGPDLWICVVDSAFEALKHANNSRYGLAGFVFAGDLAKGLTLCEGTRLELLLTPARCATSCHP